MDERGTENGALTSAGSNMPLACDGWAIVAIEAIVAIVGIWGLWVWGEMLFFGEKG